ncbi:MAG TPA: hypothetical protein VN696_06740 [Pyrinomonadaceae bacterium]|nr:hypothetical protein [Pyrinomonadaceae bacterium]
MKNNRKFAWLLSLVALLVILNTANAQEREAFPKEQVEAAKRGGPQTEKALVATTLGCRGPITQVVDVGDENLRVTSAVYGTNPGGGEGQQFDKTPLLSTTVTLAKGTCLDAHVSAIVGSKQTYRFVSRMTFFQVTLTRIGPVAFPPRHMVGHFHTPFGINSPAVALEAEHDVDMYASNFFQKVGQGPHEIAPGTYRVDLWWAGGPDPGGAIGAAFVLKLYLR